MRGGVSLGQYYSTVRAIDSLVSILGSSSAWDAVLLEGFIARPSDLQPHPGRYRSHSSRGQEEDHPPVEARSPLGCGRVARRSGSEENWEEVRNKVPRGETR